MVAIFMQFERARLRLLRRGCWTMPPGRGDTRDSWRHWRRTTSMTTLMPSMHTSPPRRNYQPLQMDQKVWVLHSSVMYVRYIVVFCPVEKKKKTRTNADHFKQVNREKSEEVGHTSSFMGHF